MIIALAAVELAVAIATGTILMLLLKQPIGALIKATARSPIDQGLEHLFALGVIAIAVASGAGFLVKSRYCGSDSDYFAAPQSALDHIAFVYNTVLASVVGVYSLTVVVVFTLMVLYVGLRRTHIMAGKEKE